MKQVVQHVLTLIMGLVVIAGSVAGCANSGGTARQSPRAATGTAAGGTSAGGLLAQGDTSAAVEGLSGGLIGNAVDMERDELVHAARMYNYNPSQGTVVRIQDATVEPPTVKPGGHMNLVTHYALLTPTPDVDVTVIERWHITKDGQVLGSPVRTVLRQGGAWVSTLPVLLPTAVDSGDYRVTMTVEAVEQQDSESTNFTVRESASP